MKPKLLYICSNDGSDMRVQKEIKTLSADFDISFVGIGALCERSVCMTLCAECVLVPGRARSPLSIVNLCATVVKLRARTKYATAHVVNEQLFIFVQPLLIGIPTVLDVFDSIFLRISKEGNKWLWAKYYTYAKPSAVIVTDDTRCEKLPEFVKHKSLIIPNYPVFDQGIVGSSKESSHFMRLALFGSIAESRGASLVKELLEESPSVLCFAAGWCYDNYSRDLMKHERVKWLGVMNQCDANKFIAKHVDYVVCVYPVNNLNNVYASPNKVYDAFHNKTPLIINKSVFISGFVEKSQIGIVFDERQTTKEIYKKLADGMLGKAFNFNESPARKYSWDNYADKLIGVHAKSMRL